MKLGMVAGNRISIHFSLRSTFLKSNMAAKIQDGRHNYIKFSE
jgi:hypothetical protein